MLIVSKEFLELLQECNKMFQFEINKMMKNINNYTLNERKMMAKTGLVAVLFEISIDSPDADIIEKLKELSGLFNSGIAQVD